MYDAIVIGGGPAGLSAALWLGRYRCRTLVLDAGEPRNRFTEAGHGYFPDDTFDPSTILKQGREALHTYPTVELRDGRAIDVANVGDAFSVNLGNEQVEARALVLATGVVDVFPDVAHLERHYGADVFTCPACDGWEARDTDTVVIGWSEDIVGFALKLLRWARSVTIVTDGRRLPAEEHHRARLRDACVEVFEDEALELVGERGDLEGVVLRGRGLVPCRKLFFSIDTHLADPSAEKLGCEISDEGCVLVDWDAMTSVQGVYAAGDITPGPQLVQIAAAEGAVAGIACAKAIGRR